MGVAIRSVLPWFCCLNERERVAMRTVALAFPLTLFQFVQQDVFDLVWLGFGLSLVERRGTFLAHFDLYEDVMEHEGNSPLAVLRTSNIPFWVEVSLYVGNPEAACLSGCEHQSFP
jgi:hypothetical protein